MSAPITGYAELQAVSNFSFLRGAAHPEELVDTAAALGHHALAIADHNTLAGVVRGHVAARAHDLRYVVASRLDLVDGPSVLALPQDRAAYGRLSRLLSLGKRRATKGIWPRWAAATTCWSCRRPVRTRYSPAIWTGLARCSEGNAGSPGICFTAAGIAPGWLIWPNWRAAIALLWWRPARSITMSPSGAPCRMF